jgi:hypothetical protein
MSGRNFNVSKQLFISVTVALAFFVVGLVWAAAWEAEYFIKVEFDMISDRYNPSIGEMESGNLYVRSEHWGNMTNRSAKKIVSRFSAGVAWFDDDRFPFDNTDIDLNNVTRAGGDYDTQVDKQLATDEWHLFHETYSHFKVVDAVVVNNYWAGAFTTTLFIKGKADGNRARHSKQERVDTDSFAPNGTIRNTVPSSRSGIIN